MAMMIPTVYLENAGPRLRKSYPLPRLDFTLNHGEKWMGCDFPKAVEHAILFRIAKPQLSFQAPKLIIELPLGDRQRLGLFLSGDLR